MDLLWRARFYLRKMVWQTNTSGLYIQVPTDSHFLHHNSLSLALSMPIVFNITETVFGEDIISLCTQRFSCTQFVLSSDILLHISALFPNVISLKSPRKSYVGIVKTNVIRKQIIYKTFSGFTWPIRLQMKMYASVSSNVMNNRFFLICFRLLSIRFHLSIK